MVLGAMLFIFHSTRLMFERPDNNISRYIQRISSSLQNDEVLALWSFDGPDVVEWARGHRDDSYALWPAKGHFGKARHFKGEDGSRVITEVRLESFGWSYTISTWVKINKTDGDQYIIAGHEAYNKPLCLLDNKMTFGVFDSSVAYEFSKYGEFVNIVAVADLHNRRAYIYENGELKVTGEVGLSRGLGESVVFGNFRQGNPSDYTLDETVIWQRMLSPEEIKDNYKSRRPYLRKIAGSKLLKIAIYSAIRDSSNAILNGLALFNPFSCRGKNAQQKDVCLNLLLSKRDLRFFNKWHNAFAENGCPSDGYEDEREMSAEYKGGCARSSLSLIPITTFERDTVEHSLPGGLLLWRKAFSLTTAKTNFFEGLSRVNLYPPENVGFVLPVLAGKLIEKCGGGHFPAGFVNLSINGNPEGLYYYEQADNTLNLRRGLRKNELISQITKLPLTKESILRAYDDLVNTYAPLMAEDATTLFSARMLTYELRVIRQQLENSIDEKQSGTELGRITENLSENLFLGSNQASTFVTCDLNFMPRQIDDLYVKWRSRAHDLIDDNGALLVHPDTNVFAEACVEAQLYTKGSTNCVATKLFDLTIVPKNLKLPILSIYVEPGPIGKNTTKSKCVMRLRKYGEDGYETKYVNGRIELKGFTTLVHPKKSYHVRTDNECEFPGFYKAKDFYLRAGYIDHTFMRDKLSLELFSSMGENKGHYKMPHFQHVELFVNDKYQGVYLFGEVINAKFLGLSEYKKGSKRNSVIYFAKSHHATFDKPVLHSYVRKEPGWKNMAGEFWGPLLELIDFCGKSSPQKFAAEITNHMDVAEVMDFQILLNFACNRDGANANMFIVKDAGKSDRFYMVPWDYEETFKLSAKQPLSNFLFKRLATACPWYKEQLKNRWTELRQKQFSSERILQKISVIEAELAEAVERNNRAWPYADAKSYQGELDVFRDWILQHLQFLDKYFGLAAISETAR